MHRMTSHRPLFRTTFISSFLTAAFLLTTIPDGAGQALAQRRSGTLPGPSGTIQQTVPVVLRDSLPNGVQIYFTRVNDLPLAEINIIVDAGIITEPEDAHGVAYGVSQLLLAGSSNRSGEMIVNYLTQLGSIVVPYTHYDYSQVYGKTLTKNFSETLGVLADAVSAPQFPAQDLLRLQRDAAVRLFRNSSSGEKATIAAVKRICGENSTLSRSLLPTEEEVQALTLEKLRAFHSSRYQPQRTTVIITGNLDYRFVKTALIEAFGKWTRGNTVIAAADAAGDGVAPNSVLLLSDSTTPNGLTYFRLGHAIGSRNDRNFAPLMLLNSVLGEGAHALLRETLWGKHLISPNFTTAVAFSKDCSYFMISGSASPIVTDSVLTFIEDLLVETARNGVTETALAEARKNVLAGDALTFASNRNLQSLLKEAAVYQIPLEKQFSMREQILAVRAADVQRVAAELLQPGKMSTVVLGDQGKVLPLIEGLGKTAAIRE